MHRGGISSGSPGERPHSAVTSLFRLNGSSQPSVIMTTGAELYVVKFLEFTGKYGLMGEVVGTELMGLMGLPTPQWAAIQVTDKFLDQHPETWYKSRPGDRGIRPESGLHFGSRLAGSAGRSRTYDLIPGSWADRVANREDFVGALLLDLWANNCDRRQCVFLKNNTGSVLRAVFIDNDHMFGGFYGDEHTCPTRTMMPDLRFYSGLWCEETVGRWRSVINGISDVDIEAILSRVPAEWADRAALDIARDQLRMRRRKLDYLIAEAQAAIGGCRGPGVCEPRYAAEPAWAG